MVFLLLLLKKVSRNIAILIVFSHNLLLRNIQDIETYMSHIV